MIFREGIKEIKTKDFERDARALGFKVYNNKRGLIEVRNALNKMVMVLREDKWGFVDTNWSGFEEMDSWEDADSRFRLLELAVCYIFTPVDEREDIKKYCLTLPSPYSRTNAYLNLDLDLNTYVFTEKLNGNGFQTEFTQEEIDNMPNQEFIQTLIKEDIEND